MNLNDIIPIDRIFHYTNVPADKYALLEDLLDKTLTDTAHIADRQPILESLIERERSMSTGIGSGIAIPHCSTQYIDGMQASIAILNEDMAFDAVDGQPVRVVVLLLLSRNDFDRHIKTLAAIARAFNQEKLREAVSASKSPSEVKSLFAKWS